MIHTVKQFHKKFNLPDGEVDVVTGPENIYMFALRTTLMEEELGEFITAVKNNDRVKAFDALLDLAYVVNGTALCMGVSPDQWYDGVSAVHGSNLMKKRVSVCGKSKRGSSFDIVKPDGWEGPEHRLKEILDNV